MKEHTVTTIRQLLEADDRLRDLERQWQSTGSLEDELAYHMLHHRSHGYVELTKLSTEFTRWREARKWFKKIYDKGRWENDLRAAGKPMRQVVRDIESELLKKWSVSHLVEVGGVLSITTVAWRSYQVHGFLVYFQVHEGYDSDISYEMCASLSLFGSSVSWQSVNANCSHTGSYGLTSAQASTNKDAILLSTPGMMANSAVWAAHIRAGK